MGGLAIATLLNTDRLVHLEAARAGGPFLLQLLGIVAVIPVQPFTAGTLEEPLFRGFLLGGLERLRVNTALAVVAQAALFTLRHLSFLPCPEFYLLAPVCGIVFALLTLASKRLSTGMLAHATVNAFIYTLVPLVASAASLMPDVLGRSSIRSEWHDDLYPQIWAKFVFIASFGMITACFDKTLGEVMESDELSARVRAVMQEISALAARRGIRLPPSIVEDSHRKGSEFPPHTRTSFQRDVEAPDRPDERDLLGGTIVRLGRQVGVPTPQTDEVYGMINERKPPRYG